MYTWGYISVDLQGRHLDADEVYRWHGETLFLKSRGVDANSCTLGYDDGGHARYFLERQPRRAVRLPGAFVPAAASSEGDLTCGGPVLVATGWSTYLSSLASYGQWVVVPAAAAIVAGGALRTSRRQPRALG